MRVLITGAGGPAAICFFRALPKGYADCFMVDMDPYATGLYLVPADHRFLVPRGDAPEFVPAVLSLCAEHRIDVLVSTVDAELMPLARVRDQLKDMGTELALSDLPTLERCHDKLALLDAARSIVPVSRYAKLDESTSFDDWPAPFIAKPRVGSGSRGVELIRTRAEFDRLPRNGTMLVQEFLPGAEYSIDVYATAAGTIIASVPRERLKIDSGIAVVSRTVRRADLMDYAAGLVRSFGLRYAINVQVRFDVRGEPKLLEINPRFSGTMALTVRAGANMPLFCLQEVGECKPLQPVQFQGIGVVRYWDEKVVSLDELSALEDVARGEANSKGEGQRAAAIAHG